MGLSAVNHIALDGTGTTSVGGSIQLNASGLAGPFALFVASHAQAKLPLFGGTLLVELSPTSLIASVASTGGSSTWSLPIPANPVLAGLEFHFQAASPNSALPDGWGLSNGVRLLVCP